MSLETITCVHCGGKTEYNHEQLTEHTWGLVMETTTCVCTKKVQKKTLDEAYEKAKKEFENENTRKINDDPK